MTTVCFVRAQVMIIEVHMHWPSYLCIILIFLFLLFVISIEYLDLSENNEYTLKVIIFLPSTLQIMRIMQRIIKNNLFPSKSYRTESKVSSASGRKGGVGIGRLLAPARPRRWAEEVRGGG